MTQHEIQRLLPRHYTIVELTLSGYGPKEIAQALGMTPQAVTIITKSPNFQAELSRRRQDQEKQSNEVHALGVIQSRKMLEEASVMAAQTHISLMDPEYCPDPKIRQTSASKILDLVLDDQRGPKNVIVMQPGSLLLLQQALKEATGEEIEVDGVSQPAKTE